MDEPLHRIEGAEDEFLDFDLLEAEVVMTYSTRFPERRGTAWEWRVSAQSQDSPIFEAHSYTQPEAYSDALRAWRQWHDLRAQGIEEAPPRLSSLDDSRL